MGNCAGGASILMIELIPLPQLLLACARCGSGATGMFKATVDGFMVAKGSFDGRTIVV